MAINNYVLKNKLKIYEFAVKSHLALPDFFTFETLAQFCVHFDDVDELKKSKGLKIMNENSRDKKKFR